MTYKRKHLHASCLTFPFLCSCGSDGPLLKPSKKSNARKRCPTENKTTECVGPDAENVSNSSIVSRLGSPAVGIRHAKRVRNESLR